MITKSQKVYKVRVASETPLLRKSPKKEPSSAKVVMVYAARSESLRRSNAIVALEGYVPTSFDLELDRRFISGKISHTEAIALINKTALKFKERQTRSKKSFKVAMA